MRLMCYLKIEESPTNDSFMHIKCLGSWSKLYIYIYICWVYFILGYIINCSLSFFLSALEWEIVLRRKLKYWLQWSLGLSVDFLFSFCFYPKINGYLFRFETSYRRAAKIQTENVFHPFMKIFESSQDSSIWDLSLACFLLSLKFLMF